MESKNKLRVMLVEDEEDFRWLFTLLGQSHGYDVVEAANGRAALDLLIGGAQVDVIALDLRMPEVDGFEFLRLYDGPVPVVVMSAYDPEHTEPLAREPFARVTKPLNMEEAVGKLRAAAASWRH